MSSPADALLGMPVRDFRELVHADARDQLDEPFRSALRDPAVVEAWHDQLVDVKMTIERQLATRAAAALAKQQECLRRGAAGKAEWFAYKAEYARWRASAIHAKTSVERRLPEAKRALRARNVADTERRNGQKRSAADTLASTVKMIAHYPLDRDPEGLGSGLVGFFQQAARDALDEYHNAKEVA